jgi:hypothetical protein
MKELVVLGVASRRLAEEARARSAELDREGRSTSTAPHWPTGATTWFLRQVDETLEPGRAALFVVVSGGADPERAIEALAPLAPRVLCTNLDPAAEQRLLAAFTEPAPRPGSTSPSPPASE